VAMAMESIYRLGLIISTLIAIAFVTISYLEDPLTQTEILTIFLIGIMGCLILLFLERQIKKRQYVMSVYLLITLYLLAIFLDFIVALPFTPEIVDRYQIGLVSMLTASSLTILWDSIQTKQ
jgi:predicted membrane channel-forming protein YqfA (hemolysin III family)